MNMKSWNIQRKILALLLSAGLLSFLALGAVSFFSMYSLSADAEESGRRMGESAADFTEEFATDLAKRRLLAVAEEKATNIDVYLIEVKNDISYIAQSMTAIFAHPETHNPRRLPQPQEKIIASGEAYIFFAPELQRRGISPALAEEIGLASNIADNISIMAGFYEGYQISCYIGSKNGYLICVDNMADGGNVAFTEDFFTTFDPRERPWYQAIAQSKTELGHGEAITTGTYLGADGYPVITHAAPYYDADGFAGVAGMGTSLESLCTYLVEEQRKSQYIIFALNQKGEVVFSSMKEGTLAAVAEHRDLRESEQKSLAFEAACMTAGLSDVGLVTIDGVEYYLAYAPIPSLGWSLGTLIERSTVIQPSVSAKEIILTQAADFLASVQSFFTDSLLRMAILLFVILAALVWGSRKAAERFVRPILALRDGVREIAMGNFDSKVEIQTGDEIGELADSVNAMSQELKAYVDNLSKVTAEKERIATELDLATNIQEGMLPSIFPTFSDRPDFALYATMHPAKEVGGDFYDFYMLDESHIAVTVADVSGKGVPAALFMVVAKTVLKNAAMAAAAAAYGVGGGLPDFAAIVTGANRQLAENNKEKMFVTVFFGVLDTKTGAFSYVDGGHNPPLVGRKDGGKTTWGYLNIEKKGFPLGVRKKAAYTAERLALRPGDALYLYTDGVTEAMDEAGNLYGEERLQATLNGTAAGATVQEILSAAKGDVTSYVGAAEQSDDITMLGLRYLGNTSLS